MCTPDLRGLLCLLLAAAAFAEDAPHLGEQLSAAEVEAIDFTVLPDGSGLPPGSGDARAGREVYRAHCQACHGEDGQGGINDVLVGGRGSLDGPAPLQTVGSYWPYATTLFGYLWRAMPYNAPGSLDNDELYAVTAYVLFLNDIVAEDELIDARSLAAVVMPNRDRFDHAWPPR